MSRSGHGDFSCPGAEKASPGLVLSDKKRIFAENYWQIAMRIVEIPSFFPPYGGEFCMDQAKALAALGHEVTVLAHVQLGLTVYPKGWLHARTKPSRLEEDGVCVVRTEMRGFPRSPRLNARRWTRGVRRLFAAYVRERGVPDVIHAHCCKWAGYAACLLSREYGVPYVVTEHLPASLLAEELGEPRRGIWQVEPLREAYREAAMVIPVSEELVDDLAPYFGKDYRWTAISNIVDTGFFHFQPRPSLRGRRFRFCCVANYVPRKGYDVLFQAFKRLSARCDNVELHIAGRFIAGRECRQAIEALGLGDRVVNHGELDKEDVRRLLYTCDCLVLASRGEAQGLVLLEAMATGIPVVTTDRVPRNALVEGGSLVVPVDDAAALAQAMFRMIEHYPEASASLSAKVVEMCSPKSVGQRIASVLEAATLESCVKSW